MSDTKDTRKLEPVKNAPGVYRRHGYGCAGGRKCGCPYVVRWTQGGKSRKRQFAKYDLAKEFKGKLDGKTAPRKPQTAKTIAEYYGDWLPGYRGRTKRGLEESTRRDYEICFRLHIIPLIGHVKLRDLSARDVRDELLHKMERRGASPATIRRTKVALSVMLACAVEDDDLPANPCSGVRYVPTSEAKRAHPAREHRALTAADVVAILQAMPEQWRAFFAVLAQTGMRIGELLGLTWAHVHLGDDPHITITEQVYRGERKKLKSEHSHRDVPLASSMASWLSTLRATDVEASAPVFPSKVGSPLGYSNVYHRVLRPALVTAGIAQQTGTVTVRRRGKDVKEPVWDYQGVGFHRFRHACGSLLLAKGGKDLRQVSAWLGHAKPSFTHDVYIDLVDGGLGGAEAWDELLPGAMPGAIEDPETAANGTAADAAKTGD